MSFIKKICKIILVLILSFLAFVLLFIFFTTITDYKPEKEIILTNMPNAAAYNSDTIEILTWNIGYAGLDKSMDFFYDGGKATRTSKQNTVENLNSIVVFLDTLNSDFIFLQEVDKNSKRSYNIDMVSVFAKNKINYTTLYATNYSVPFVPMPILSPLAKVESGIVTLSKKVPSQSIRYAYPSKGKWPQKMFLLDRCFLMCRYNLNNDKQLIIINTHNSAFDNNGEQRDVEMEFLKEFVLDEYNKGNYVIAGGDWNQLPPIDIANVYKDIGTSYFSPVKISTSLLPSWQWISTGQPTNRFLDEPYIKGKTKETLLDFFLISPNIESISVNTIDKGYKNSDHNPVIARFVLKN